MNRREFVGIAGAAAAGLQIGQSGDKPVRLGIVGTGGRGQSLLAIALSFDGVEVPALCDIDPEHLAQARDLVATRRGGKPEGYTAPEDYKRLVSRDDLDAVLIATPWELHTPVGVCSMKAGKYTGIEVPAALTLEQCWELVNAQEQTKTPCMMLENWSFRRDNLAVLRMIRAGLLGEINHCHCAHSHDCVYWYFNPDGSPRWSGEYLLRRNADQYPTHALGPVISWMDINRGDYPAYLTSTATRSISLSAYFAKKFGPASSLARRGYRQADIVTSVVKTVKGNTIVINNDMQSPRPYDDRWEISGINGVYSEQHNGVYIAGRNARETWDPFGPFQKEFDHPWYKSLDSQSSVVPSGLPTHGGPDFVEIQQFLKACREKRPLPLDIYDSVIMCAPIPLSEESISKGSQPFPFPDFTRGKWKAAKPYFAEIEA